MDRIIGTGLIEHSPTSLPPCSGKERYLGGTEIDPLDFLFCFFCMPCYNHQKLHDDYGSIRDSSCRTLTGCYSLTCCYSFEKLFGLDLCPCISRDGPPKLKTEGGQKKAKTKEKKSSVKEEHTVEEA